MNFKKLLLFLAAPLAIAMSSCTPEAPVYTLPEIKITNAEGSEVSEINVEAEGGEVTINITATRSWAINSQSDWFSCTPMSDTNLELVEKKVEVKFTIAPNEENSSRSESIKITMDKTTKTLNITQAGKGQVALGEVLYFDNFDKDGKQAQKGSSGWATYIDGDGQQYLNPTPDWQSGVTYGGTKLTVRSNTANGSGGQHSNYEGSGMNYLWFGTAPTNLSVSNILLSHLEGNALTLSFGTERYEYNASDNTFKNDEFQVYISGDGEKWSQIEYSFLDGVNLNGKWNIATAQFNLKEVPEKLHIYITTSVSSAYALDDLKLMAGGGGVEIDLSQGTTIEGAGGGNTGGGSDTPTTNAPETLVEATIAEFLAAPVSSDTWYKLTGEIINIAKEDYGNFTIKDATDEVYIYGMTNGWVGSNNKSFSQIGLKVGDTVTLGTLRGEYNGTPQGGGNPVPAYYISHVAGEGGTTEPEPPVAGDGEYASDSQFVCTADNSTNAVYTLGATTIGGQSATGFKLGKSKQQGKFTSAAIGVTGDKYLNFYAVAWGAGGDATIYFRVNGGTVIEQAIKANSGASGNPPYNNIVPTENDHYSIKLTGLAATDVIEFSSNAAFDCAETTDYATRAIFFGVKLTDEPLSGNTGGGTTTPDPDPEPDPDPTPGDVNTIAGVLALGQNATVPSGATIEAVVISNQALNNMTSKKGLYVQDATGGLQFYLAANHEFAFGDKLQIDLGGATIGNYNGATQISGLALEKITKLSSGNTVEAKTVSIADFLANKYESQYVAIENVQVADADLNKTWATAAAGQHNSINIVDANGNAFVVFTGKYATDLEKTVAQGSGTIKGISSISKGAMQLIFAQDSDYADLTGTRFGGGTTTPDPEPELPTDLAGSGEGTEASPYDVTRALDIINRGVAATDAVYTKGIISSITEVSPSYGNATFQISVDGTTTTELTVFRSKYLNGEKFTAEDQIKVGDEVVVVGVLVLYNGTTPEISTCNLVSLNSADQGGEDTPVTPEPEPEVGEWAGRDDFNTVGHNSGYTERKTTAGWIGENCAVQSGGEKDANPVLPSLLGNDTNTRAFCMTGKTTAVGKITSPVLTTGCGKLKFTYGLAFTDNNGVDINVEIMQNGSAVKTFNVKQACTKYQVLTFEEEVNVAGDFQIVFTNNCPSQNTGNKDRVSIWDIMWTASAAN